MRPLAQLGLLPALHDQYHGLIVLLDRETDADEWFGHPWVEAIGVTDGDWDCPYRIWLALFTPKVPASTLRLELSDVGADAALPAEVSVVPHGDGWAVTGRWGQYWCELIPSGWAEMPNNRFVPLLFKTPSAAKAAYILASRVYAERDARQEVAYEVLGIKDD